MGRFVYWMNVSADLRIEHADGEQGGGDWMRITEELHREFNARARALGWAPQYPSYREGYAAILAGR